MPIYTDRRDAGRRLADALAEQYRETDAVILAMVRGGLPVAVEVAAELEADLDVFLVRKVGVPGHEELAAGQVDAFVCPEITGRLPGVGAAYEAFPQVEDDEVTALLREARGEGG